MHRFCDEVDGTNASAMAGLLDAAREMRETGELTFTERSVTTAELNTIMQI